MNLSQYWITAYDDSQSVTLRADDDDWNWSNDAIQGIVMPLVSKTCKQVWANGMVYQLAE